jgi:hypothetical protein
MFANAEWKGGSKGVRFRQWALTVSLNLIKDKEFTRFMVDYSINLMWHVPKMK